MNIFKFNSKFKIAGVFIALFALAFSGFTQSGVKSQAQASDLNEVNCSGAPTTPTFNPFPIYYGNGIRPTCTDFPIVQGRHANDHDYPASQSEHQAGMNANMGDQIKIAVWVHNGTSDSNQTVMRNVKVALSTDMNTGSSHAVTATLSADNAQTKTGTWKINTPSNAKLELVQGSGQVIDTSYNLVADGQTYGNNVVNLGDKRGCYQYAHFIVYIVKVVQGDTQTQGQLSITKDVRNISTSTSFSDTVSANQGETLEYRIKVRATSGTVNNVTVKDNFPSSQLSYQTGSLLVNGNTGYSGLSSTGLTFNTIDTNGIEITYRAQAAIASGTITNTATASSPNAPTVTDSAMVNVQNNCTSCSCTNNCNQNTSLSITKEVRSLTQNTSFSKNATASQNDQVEYRIRVRNTGNATANDVRISDNVTGATQVLSSFSNVSVNRSYNGSLSSGLSVGSLNQGDQIEITYRATVIQTGYSVQNTATAYASNASSVQDTATLTVGGNKGNLTIQKFVRKAYSGNSFAKSAYVNDGDTVEYQIQVSSNSGSVNNVRLTENYINGFTLNSGSARLDNSSISDSFMNSSLSLGNLYQGQTKTLTFMGIVRNSSSTQQTVTNTASATGDNVNSVQDTATVYVQGVQTGNKQLSINKVVRNNTTGTSYQKSVNGSQNDQVSFQITVTNTGNASIDNVTLNDNWTNGLNLSNSQVRVDGTNQYVNMNGSSFSVNLGTMYAGQQKLVTIDGTVNTSSGSITNTARASGNGVNDVTDSATINIQTTGTASLNYSKSAYNETQGKDATTGNAQREDYITYTLTVRNNGNAAQNGFVISDDLSGVLPLADMVSLNGGSLNGNTITYPAVDIAAGQTVTKTFKVRIKYFLAGNLSYTMINTYGNTVRITINTPTDTGPIIAPKTGVDAGTASAFGGLAAGMAFAFRKRRTILKAIFS